MAGKHVRAEGLLTGDMILTMNDRLCMVMSVRREGLLGEEESYVWVLTSGPGRSLNTLCLGHDGTVRVVSR